MRRATPPLIPLSVIASPPLSLPLQRGGDDRAFLLYLGNILGTHTKMPQTSTDDFLAVEIVEGGRCKLTIDLGAGEQIIYSKNPILYDQWNQLEIERHGYEGSGEKIRGCRNEGGRNKSLADLVIHGKSFSKEPPGAASGSMEHSLTPSEERYVDTFSRADSFCLMIPESPFKLKYLLKALFALPCR